MMFGRGAAAVAIAARVVPAAATRVFQSLFMCIPDSRMRATIDPHSVPHYRGQGNVHKQNNSSGILRIGPSPHA